MFQTSVLMRLDLLVPFSCSCTVGAASQPKIQTCADFHLSNQADSRFAADA